MSSWSLSDREDCSWIREAEVDSEDAFLLRSRELVRDMFLAIEVLVNQPVNLSEVGEVLLREAILGELALCRLDLIDGNVRVVVGREMKALEVGIRLLQCEEIAEMVVALRGGEKERFASGIGEGWPENL